MTTITMKLCKKMLAMRPLHDPVLLLTSFLTLFCLASCGDDDGPRQADYEETRHKIAVICPQEWRSAWQATAAWAGDNIAKGQTGMPRRVALDIEWFDETAADIAGIASRIADSGEYALIIGPAHSDNAYTLARQVEGRIPVLLPLVTSTELQRIYGGHNGMWFFTQSDITQCEILLTQAKIAEKHKVALVTSNDEYGKSFSDWFAYQATELGLAAEDIFIYDDEGGIKEAVGRLADSRNWFDKAVVFAPSSEDDAIAFDNELGRLKSELTAGEILYFPDVLCSDAVNSPNLKGRLRNLRYEGICPSADPRSGWASAYSGRFGVSPSSGEAQLYDALLLSAFSLFSQKEGEELNDAIMRIVDGRESSVCDGWTATDMQPTFARLAAGESPDIRGVTGDWNWDAKFHNSVTGTFYSHWILDNGEYTTVEYLTLNGRDGSISSTQAWEWAASHQQTFDRDQKDLVYPELNDRFAVVIGASDTWLNYRHQADALAMYQMLKSEGYDDDHIILIIEDNIAYDPRNVIPGNVRVTIDGENLYHDVKVDYKLSEISVNDLSDILSGKSSDRLPHVISPTGNDNLIMFWCGHGARNTLMWGSYDDVMGSDMNKIVGKLHSENRYRKLLFVLDACYSGTIGEAIEGIPGALVFTAALANEPSKADIYDNDMNVWLSNGFTRTFRDEISKDPNISLRDLYYETVRGTKGSHPHIYNAENYGNMHRETIREFL